MSQPIYKRILLKLSGEALQGDEGFGIDPSILDRMALEIKELIEMGVEVGVVLGGGNLFRGAKLAKAGMNRVVGDHMGMLATVINALALADALEQTGVTARVQTAIAMQQIAEPYIRGKAVRHLEKGRVVVFGCGTGNPFFSTDTGAALRAAEIDADVILKATNVDGVYDSDPKTNPNAQKYDTLTHQDILSRQLGVMDSTAASLCRDNHMPILVFNLSDPDNIYRAILGEEIGTLVK